MPNPYEWDFSGACACRISTGERDYERAMLAAAYRAAGGRV